MQNTQSEIHGPLHLDSHRYSSYKTEKIKEGDKIPSGSHFYCLSDFNCFDDFFEKLDENIKSYRKVSKEDMEEKLGENTFNLDLFYKLTLLGVSINKRYPLKKDGISREDIYNENKTEKLSIFFENGKQACVEYSLLAQKFLQNNNIKSSLFFGEVFFQGDNIEELVKDDIYGSAHTFILIEDNEKFYIYDPANPKGGYPNILEIDKNFFLLLKKRKNKTLIKATNIINGSISYYGNGSGGSIYDTNIITEKVPSDIDSILKQ